MRRARLAGSFNVLGRKKLVLIRGTLLLDSAPTSAREVGAVRLKFLRAIADNRTRRNHISLLAPWARMLAGRDTSVRHRSRFIMCGR